MNTLRTQGITARCEKAPLTNPQCSSEDRYFNFSLKINRWNLSSKDRSKRNRILTKTPCLHNISYIPCSPAIFDAIKLLNWLVLEYSVSLKIKNLVSGNRSWYCPVIWRNLDTVFNYPALCLYHKAIHMIIVCHCHPQVAQNNL